MHTSKIYLTCKKGECRDQGHVKIRKIMSVTTITLDCLTIIAMAEEIRGTTFDMIIFS